MSVAALASQALVELAVNSEPLSEQNVVRVRPRPRSTHRVDVGLDEASGRFLYSLPNCRFATHRPDIYSGPVFGGEVWT